MSDNRASVVQVGVITDIRTDKKEHSSDLVRRVHASFVHSKLNDLSVHFTMVDGPGKKRQVSNVQSGAFRN